jgi:hypothetical protein
LATTSASNSNSSPAAVTSHTPSSRRRARVTGVSNRCADTAEVARVVLEIAVDLGGWIGRDVARHRVIPVLHHAGVGVDVQRIVALDLNAVADAPQTADVGVFSKQVTGMARS